MNESDESWAESVGPDGLAVELQQTFLAGCRLLGLPEPDQGLPAGWQAVSEHLFALRGEVTVRQAAEGARAVYLEEARLPADATAADPAYDPCWQAVVLLAHGAGVVDPDPEDRRRVHERVQEFVAKHMREAARVVQNA
jgi:hypothetical protein